MTDCSEVMQLLLKTQTEQADDLADDDPQVGGHKANTGLILNLLPANERRRYEVTPSPIGWVQT